MVLTQVYKRARPVQDTTDEKASRTVQSEHENAKIAHHMQDFSKQLACSMQELRQGADSSILRSMPRHAQIGVLKQPHIWAKTLREQYCSDTQQRGSLERCKKYLNTQLAMQRRLGNNIKELLHSRLYVIVCCYVRYWQALAHAMVLGHGKAMRQQVVVCSVLCLSNQVDQQRVLRANTRS